MVGGETMFVDALKAHLNGICEDDVYIGVPEKFCRPGKRRKLNYWLYGFRPVAAAWEKLYGEKLEGVGFSRGVACGVIFHHPDRDITLAVHGNDFSFCVG